MKIARIVFYLELLLNFASASLAFFNPAGYVSLFTAQPLPAVALELIRWSGVLLYVFVYVMARALRQKSDDALSIVVEGFLLGDLVQLVAVYQFGQVVGTYSTLIGSTALVIILAAARIYWLVGHYRQKATAKTA
jgi:hypothetical protein